MALLIPFLQITQASAAEEGVFDTLLESADRLLFEEHNLTLDGEMVFTLDGERFKTARVHYVQDGGDTLYRLQLFTPRVNEETGETEDRETGFLVIVNDYNVYSMETYTPGTYGHGSDIADDTILVRSMITDQVYQLAKGLLREKEKGMEGRIQVDADEDGGKTIQVSMGQDDADDMLNAVLTIAAHYVIGRYSGYGVDGLPNHYSRDYDNYVSVAAAIADTTDVYRLGQVQLSAKLDAEGRYVSVQGNAEVQLHSNTGSDEDRILGVTFEGTAGEYGESSVEQFDPESYGVISLREYMESRNVKGEMKEYLTGEMARLAELAGYDPDLLGRVSVTNNALHDYFASAQTEDGAADLWIIAFDDPQLPIKGFQDLEADWLEYRATVDTDEVTDEEVRSKTQEGMTEFLNQVHPELLGYLDWDRLMTWEDSEGRIYCEIDCDTGDPVYDSVTLVVQVSPTWRVEYYSSAANG
ncbi:MAG: hypothetical protein IJ083_00610 [Clostridia bacterium]|nr:hypothetical protein [Clostridia bacterium]